MTQFMIRGNIEGASAVWADYWQKQLEAQAHAR